MNRRLVRAIAIPVLGIGALFLAESNLSCSKKEPVHIEYNNYHLMASLPSGLYERYERTGYDGMELCMQVLNKGDLKIFDGMGMHHLIGCDGIADATAAKNRYGSWKLYDQYDREEESEFWFSYCSDNGYKCIELEGAFDKEGIRALVSEWNTFRAACNQKSCYKTLEVSIR